jgi:hypothetical protein
LRTVPVTWSLLADKRLEFVPGSFHLQVEATAPGKQLNSLMHFDLADSVKIEIALAVLKGFTTPYNARSGN